MRIKFPPFGTHVAIIVRAVVKTPTRSQCYSINDFAADIGSFSYAQDVVNHGYGTY